MSSANEEEPELGSLRSVVPRESRDRFEELYRSAKHCVKTTLTLVNDLLDFAKIENAAFQFYPQYMNLPKRIDKVLQTLEFQARQKKIEMDF